MHFSSIYFVDGPADRFLVTVDVFCFLLFALRRCVAEGGATISVTVVFVFCGSGSVFDRVSLFRQNLSIQTCVTLKRKFTGIAERNLATQNA